MPGAANKGDLIVPDAFKTATIKLKLNRPLSFFMRLIVKTDTFEINCMGIGRENRNDIGRLNLSKAFLEGSSEGTSKSRSTPESCFDEEEASGHFEMQRFKGLSR